MLDTDVGRIEIGTGPHIYTPHIEYPGYRGEHPRPFPSDFRQRFQRIEGVYPQEPIQRMRADGYNPIILGYSHTTLAELEAIKIKLEQLKLQDPQRTFKALQEIDPQQLKWIREFLAAEAECKEKGTVGGKPARPDELQRMQDYRRRLQSNNAEYLSLWYLDNGVDVKSIEHPDVKRWIQADRTRGIWGEGEESFGFSRREDLQPFYTAVRRDGHGLLIMDKERPDIVSVGAMHALKYDMLLQRSGQRSLYYLNKPFEWDSIMRHWEEIHARYTHLKS